MDQYAASRALAAHLAEGLGSEKNAALRQSLANLDEPVAYEDAWIFRSHVLGSDLSLPTWYLVLGTSVVAYEAESLTDEAAYAIAARHNDQDQPA
jgi:hypothetical protein